MTISIYTLADYILLGQCDERRIKRALRETASDFCIRTAVWRETLTATLTSGDTSATLTPSNTTTSHIAKVVRVTIDDGTTYRKVLPLRYVALSDAGVLSWQVYEPATNDVLSADVVIWPTLACYNFPDQVIDRHQQTLVEGATARLKELPPPLRDFDGAALCRRAYERGIRRTIVGADRRGHKFFGMRPPLSVINNAPGTPLAWGGNYEPETEDE